MYQTLCTFPVFPSQIIHLEEAAELYFTPEGNSDNSFISKTLTLTEIPADHELC